MGAALLFTVTGATTAAGQVSGVAAGSDSHRTPARHAESVHSSVLAATGSITGARVSGAYSRAINTDDRAAVNAGYWASWASGLSVPTGFTGSNSACRSGSTSAASKAASLKAINFVRSMAGLAPVTFSTTLNERSQKTALIMSANRALSHSPSRGWRCWTSTGAANAGRSNLALSYPNITSTGLVSLYMSEPGSGNHAVGHRRWVLNPFATSMGSGSTDTANSLTVIGPSSSSRPNPSWVSWPTPGYFPNAMEPRGRWSLSAGGAMSFANARVHVNRNGHAVRVVKYRVENGYARNTVVFQIPSSLARSGLFHVTVSNIRSLHTGKAYTRSYFVRMFAPTR